MLAYNVLKGDSFMSIQLFRLIKEKLELNLLKKEITNIAEEEKENINKIINFAITWWLKDVATVGSNANTGDVYADMMYFLFPPLSEEQLNSLENFKHVMGMTILKKLLISKEPIVLHCEYTPLGILGQILYESNCYFLDFRLPTKSVMNISKEQIYIKHGYGAETVLAFDVHQTYDFGNSDVQTTDDQSKEEITQNIDGTTMKIESREFIPSNYDFFNMYMQEQNAREYGKRYTR